MVQASGLLLEMCVHVYVTVSILVYLYTEEQAACDCGRHQCHIMSRPAMISETRPVKNNTVAPTCLWAVTGQLHDGRLYVSLMRWR